MANRLTQPKQPAIKQPKYDPKLQSNKFYLQDALNYSKLVHDLNQCELIRGGHIPTVIIKNIAEMAMGRWKKCFNNKCDQEISILEQDTHKIFYRTSTIDGEVTENYPMMPSQILHEMQSGALAVESWKKEPTEIGINRKILFYCIGCRIYVKTCEECMDCGYCMYGSCFCPGKFISPDNDDIQIGECVECGKYVGRSENAKCADACLCNGYNKCKECNGVVCLGMERLCQKKHKCAINVQQ